MLSGDSWFSAGHEDILSNQSRSQLKTCQECGDGQISLGEGTFIILSPRIASVLPGRATLYAPLNKRWGGRRRRLTFAGWVTLSTWLSWIIFATDVLWWPLTWNTNIFIFCVRFVESIQIPVLQTSLSPIF